MIVKLEKQNQKILFVKFHTDGVAAKASVI